MINQQLKTLVANVQGQQIMHTLTRVGSTG